MDFHTFDIDHNCPVHEFLSVLDKFDLELDSWITDGPAGGNPQITVKGWDFDIESLEKFLKNPK